jgi:hypothetical protein
VNAGARSSRAQLPRSTSRASSAARSVAAAAAVLLAFFSAALPLDAAVAAAAAVEPDLAPSADAATAAATAPAGTATAAPLPSAAAASAPGTTAPPAADPAAGDDIRDIRGPKAYLPPWLIPAIAGGLILLALAAYATWRWARRRRAPKIPQPFEIALERLEELRALMHPASVREFSIAISDVIRRYIEEAFKGLATHRTTEEFLQDLLTSAHPSLAPHRKLLAEFLNRCDLAKFAGVSFSQRDLESLHQSARSFVLSTSKPPLVTHDPLPAT